MNLKRCFRKAKAGVIRKAPTIATISAAFGVGVTVFTSIRSGLKLYPGLEKHKVKMDQLRTNKENFDDVKEYNKCVFEQYKALSFEVLKAIWPSLVSGGATTALIISSHNILQKRYLGAVAAYTSVSAALMEYRARVADKIGKDAELELITGTKTTEIVDVITDKKGNEKTKVSKVKESAETPNPEIILFDKSSPYFREGYPELNLLFLRKLEEDFTKMLKAKDRVFLNEIRDSFGYPETAEGQIIGWVNDDLDPLCDCAVDFGVFDKNGFPLETDNVKDFVNGKNDFIYLNLNLDGVVYERFPKLIEDRKRNHARYL